MTIRPVVFGLLALAAGASTVAAQGLERGIVAGRYESYSFTRGLGLSDVSELTVPVGLNARLGNRLTVALSTGFARISVTQSDGTDLSVSGVLDSEIRLGYNLIPGSLIIVATGVIPTGIKALAQEDLSILGALSSDVIGFAAPSIGSGGSVGGGVVGAVPIGRWALGVGATYKYSLSYKPVAGQQGADLRVGPELRTRIGLEGPVARRSYLRLAGVLATRGKDEFQNRTESGVGNRIIAYAALNQGLGNSQLTLYAFDVYRSSPRIEATAVGQAGIPKGNLLAGGFRLGLQFGRTTTVTPRAEFRTSSTAEARVADAGVAPANVPTRRAGSAIRFGIDLRQVLSPQVAAVVQVDGLKGDAHRIDRMEYADFSGYRVGLFLHLTP